MFLTSREMATTMNNKTNNMNADHDEEMTDEFSVVIVQLDQMKKQITQVLTNVRQLQKKYKKHKKNTNVKSGFVKPVRITKSLAEVIATNESDLVARSVVNKKLNEYIKKNGLQLHENRQTFRLDSRLAELFGLQEGDVVHYFKMQTYLKHHYPKEDPQVSAEKSSVVKSS
jgi:chromatin remodeling complex protein RSC6